MRIYYEYFKYKNLRCCFWFFIKTPPQSSPSKPRSLKRYSIILLRYQPALERLFGAFSGIFH